MPRFLLLEHVRVHVRVHVRPLPRQRGLNGVYAGVNPFPSCVWCISLVMCVFPRHQLLVPLRRQDRAVLC